MVGVVVWNREVCGVVSGSDWSFCVIESSWVWIVASWLVRPEVSFPVKQICWGTLPNREPMRKLSDWLNNLIYDRNKKITSNQNMVVQNIFFILVRAKK